MSEALQIVCPHCSTINRVPRNRLADGGNCGKCKQPLITGRPVSLNESTFARHIEKSDIPVLVDFWAEWCGPCKMMAPAFEQAAAQLAPHVCLAKVNTEQAQQLSAQFNIRSIPSLVLFTVGGKLPEWPGQPMLQVL